ncbi:E3 ubiquitin/ISG15 ligase TRIM25-like isoform X1 [Amblyraja radiata]|uniref:E3 ubiquitin/ISG15 ligase TRIM25-like isoform X1 n=1 Tax=Amblyraja radiata TaxID=386614 RepID=UPI00140233D2|nr:E3 ubiquitin/ISG15 ligase TRIM25-like isoform X1 [Amblyraja radiata]
MASVQGASPVQMRVSADKLLCSICLEVFRQPATIPCGHSFCLECIEELWERQAGSGAYSCPQCRQAFNPRPALRPNPVLCGIALDLLAEPQPEAVEEVSPGLTFCDVCTVARQPAARSCLLCLASYCKWHLRPHRLSPAFRDHPLAPPAADVGSRKCGPHRKHLELFCRTDKAFICGLCLAAEHRTHRVVSLDEEAESLKKELKKADLEMGKQLHETLLEIGLLQQDMDCIVRTSEKVKLEITNHFSAMTESIEETLRVVIEIIGGEQQAALSQAKTIRAQLEQKCMELREKKLQLEILASKSDNFKLVQESLCFSTASQVPDIPRLKSDLHSMLARASKAAADLSSQVKECLRRAMKRKLKNQGRRGCEKGVQTSEASHHTSLLPPEPKIRKIFEESLPSQSSATAPPSHANRILSPGHCSCHEADI